MDAPENTRVLGRTERMRCAVMHPACLRGTVTAGLDGIRLSKGRRIDAQSTYRAVHLDQTSDWTYPAYLFRQPVIKPGALKQILDAAEISTERFRELL